MPAVTVHYAQSLDGRIATRNGDSQWIGGPASLRLAHQLRAQHAGVLVGVGTALADNPRLTVRLVEGPSPRRIIVDSTLRIPLDLQVLTDGAAPTIVATTTRAQPSQREALAALGAAVLVVGPTPEGQVDLPRLFDRLESAEGIDSILIEGGSGVITSAFRQRLVHRLIVTIAPCLIGSGTDAVGELGVKRLSEAVMFSEARFTPLETDVIFEGRPVN